MLKTRERQKGRTSIRKWPRRAISSRFRSITRVCGSTLTDYLDTGLFLDHRIARRMLGQMSKGKDFLNLRLHRQRQRSCRPWRARSTTTVDMSRTYLEWAERNLRLNGLTGRAHRLMQADVLGWLRER